MLSDRAPRVSGEDGLKALAIAVAAENSHLQSNPSPFGSSKWVRRRDGTAPVRCSFWFQYRWAWHDSTE